MNDNAAATGSVRAVLTGPAAAARAGRRWSRNRPCSTRSRARASARPISSAGSSPTTGRRPRHRHRRLARNSACRCSTSTAVAIDLDTVKLVNDKLLAKHRFLPLVKRGKRLFLAVSDPTNLHAHRRDQVPDRPCASKPSSSKTTSCSSAVDKAIEQVDTADAELGDDEDFDLENLDVIGGDDDSMASGSRARRRRRRADRALRQQDDARRHPARRVGHPLRALREDLPHPPAHGRRAEGNRAAAGAARHEARRRASRSCRGSTSPSAACRRTAASR